MFIKVIFCTSHLFISYAKFYATPPPLPSSELEVQQRPSIEIEANPQPLSPPGSLHPQPSSPPIDAFQKLPEAPAYPQPPAPLNLQPPAPQSAYPHPSAPHLLYPQTPAPHRLYQQPPAPQPYRPVYPPPHAPESLYPLPPASAQVAYQPTVSELNSQNPPTESIDSHSPLSTGLVDMLLTPLMQDDSKSLAVVEQSDNSSASPVHQTDMPLTAQPQKNYNGYLPHAAPNPYKHSSQYATNQYGYHPQYTSYQNPTKSAYDYNQYPYHQSHSNYYNYPAQYKTNQYSNSPHSYQPDMPDPYQQLFPSYPKQTTKTLLHTDIPNHGYAEGYHSTYEPSHMASPTRWSYNDQFNHPSPAWQVDVFTPYMQAPNNHYENTSGLESKSVNQTMQSSDETRNGQVNNVYGRTGSHYLAQQTRYNTAPYHSGYKAEPSYTWPHAWSNYGY